MHVNGKCVDVAVSDLVGNESEVNQFACNNQNNQRWKFETTSHVEPDQPPVNPQPPGGSLPGAYLIDASTCSDISGTTKKTCSLKIRNSHPSKCVFIKKFYWNETLGGSDIYTDKRIMAGETLTLSTNRWFQMIDEYGCSFS